MTTKTDEPKTSKDIESLKSKSNTAHSVDKSTEVKPKTTGRGGARPGAGRKKGKLEPQTIEKMQVKKAFIDRVNKNADKLLNAQLTVALGVQYVFYRYKITYKDKNGTKKTRWSKFERVTDEEVIKQYLDGDFEGSDDEYYMITAEKPDTKTIDSLIDRSFGKAPQNIKIEDERPDPIKQLLSKFGLLEDEDENEGESDAGQTESTTEAAPKSDA